MWYGSDRFLNNRTLKNIVLSTYCILYDIYFYWSFFPVIISYAGIYHFIYLQNIDIKTLF